MGQCQEHRIIVGPGFVSFGCVFVDPFFDSNDS